LPISIRIQESQFIADVDPGKQNKCGSGDRKAKSVRIRPQESKIDADPDPQHCPCTPDLLYLFRRGLYDECGEVDDEQDPLQQDKDWEDYWRLLFPKVRLN
jgi:hypothetical protein